jgi:hypothetical protein
VTGKDAVKLSFLEWIYNQDNYERIKRYEENERYYDGDIDIKLPANVKKYLAQEYGYSGNICRAVVDASVGFLSKEPISLEIKEVEGQEENIKKAEEWVYEIFRKNNLLLKNFIKALRIQAKKGEFAYKISRVLDESKSEVIDYKITVLKPDICFPKWKDEAYEEMEYFAVEYVRYNSSRQEKEWFAQVIWPTVIKEYTRPLGTSKDQWKLINQWENKYGFINVEWTENKIDDSTWSESDITNDLKDLQNALNKSITDLVYTSDKEAFTQTFLLGANQPLDPETGEPQQIETGPGKLHIIPASADKIPKLGTIEAGNFQGLHDTLDKYLDLVSIVTKVPRIELNRIGNGLGAGGVATGVALRTIYQSFIGKTNEKSNLIKSALENIVRKLFKMAEVDNLDTNFETMNFKPAVHIRSGLPSDDKEKMEVQEKEITNKVKSRETVMQERGIEDVQKEKDLIDSESEEEDLYSKRLSEELKEEI